MKTEEVRARIDPNTKRAAEAIFAQLGVSPSEAVRMFYHQVDLQQGFPFEVRLPNKTTEQALKDTQEGRGLGPAQSLEEFVAELNEV